MQLGVKGSKMIKPNTIQDRASVARHYDELDVFYREIWGVHLHHGLWKSGQETPEEAVRNLSNYVIDKASIKSGMKVCDIGCGYGETSRILANELGAEVTALTISPEQYKYATSVYPFSNNPNYLLCDWLENNLKDNQFDAAISIESSEHMENKPRFFQEAYRTLRSNGKLVICAWLAKESPNRLEERYLLEPICREGRLPSMGSKQDYQKWLVQAGFKNIRFIDLSEDVKKTWSICSTRISKAFLFDSNFRKLMLSPEVKNRVFFKTVFRIWFAYQFKSMQYGLFISEK